MALDNSNVNPTFFQILFLFSSNKNKSMYHKQKRRGVFFNIHDRLKDLHTTDQFEDMRTMELDWFNHDGKDTRF